MAQTKTKKKKALTEFQTRLLEALKAKTEESRNKPSVKKALKDADSFYSELQKIKDKYSEKKEPSQNSKDSKKSEKAKRAEKLVNSGKFGCNTEAVAEAISILLDEDIKVDSNFKLHYTNPQYEMEEEIHLLRMDLPDLIGNLASGTVVVCEGLPNISYLNGKSFMIVQSWNDDDDYYDKEWPILVEPNGKGFRECENNDPITFRIATDEEIEAFVRKTSKTFGKERFIFA